MRCVNRADSGICAAVSAFLVLIYLELYVIFLFKGDVFVIRFFIYL